MKHFPLLQRRSRRGTPTKKFPVPTLTTPYNYQIHRTRRRFLVLFIVLALSTLFYSYAWQQQKQIAFDLVPVLVADDDILAPEEVTATQLRLKYFPRQDVPVNTFDQPDDIIGQTLIRDVVRNEILLPHHFQPNIDPESVSTKFAEFFAFSVNEDWLEGKLPNLMAHDRVDILVANPKSRDDFAQILAENLEVIEVITSKKNNAKTLIINTTQPEAEAVLLARGSRLPMQVLVRSSVRSEINNE